MFGTVFGSLDTTSNEGLFLISRNGCGSQLCYIENYRTDPLCPFTGPQGISFCLIRMRLTPNPVKRTFIASGSASSFLNCCSVKTSALV